jgi:pimeloyl-ACP methyl ester carboxylesterase
MDSKYLKNKSKQKIFYDRVEGKEKSAIFLGGLMSDRKGTKAIYFEQECKRLNYNYIRFDYLGHGESDLKFEETGIKQWLESAELIIEELSDDLPIILIGSSLGGWLMLHLALKYGKRIEKLIGIAPAIDFTEDLIWHKLDLKEKEMIEEDKIFEMKCDYSDEGYKISKQFLFGARKYLFRNEKIKIKQPIDLYHGMQDEDVPYAFSEKIAKQVESAQVKITYFKNGDHRLSEPDILKQIKIKYLCKTAFDLG